MYLQFFILTLKSSSAKTVNIYFSTRNLYILDENASKYCSQIIVVHVHATDFSKDRPACHNIVKGKNQEVTLKRLLSMLRIAQKLYCGLKVISVRCKNCSYNTVTKGIRLLDEKAFFVYTGKISCR